MDEESLGRLAATVDGHGERLTVAEADIKAGRVASEEATRRVHSRIDGQFKMFIGLMAAAVLQLFLLAMNLMRSPVVTAVPR